MTKGRKQTKGERLGAFDAIVSAYEDGLLRYASRIMADPDAAQDVVQNTFIRLFRKWRDPLVPSPALSSWLYRVAHNCAVDLVRRKSRRDALHRKQAAERPAAAPPDRGRAFRVSDAAARAAEALHVLSLRERQLVLLKVYEEKSYREISEITGLSTGNVGYILHHAMKKLAAELGGTEEA
jgi:RNA polymerase sigma-70 factor (ECF subfamily)